MDRAKGVYLPRVVCDAPLTSGGGECAVPRSFTDDYEQSAGKPADTPACTSKTVSSNTHGALQTTLTGIFYRLSSLWNVLKQSLLSYPCSVGYLFKRRIRFDHSNQIPPPSFRLPSFQPLGILEMSRFRSMSGGKVECGEFVNGKVIVKSFQQTDGTVGGYEPTLLFKG